MTDAILPPPQINIKPFMRDIALDVARAHRMTLSELKTRRRTKPLAWARFEAMWRIRQELAKPYPQIAKFFGYQNHTSAIHGVRAWQARVDDMMRER